MIVVGINDGHNASVCLSKNNKIVFALSEERITRKKNFWGYPSETLDYVLSNIVNKETIDYFGIYRDTGGDFLIWRWAQPSKNDGLIVGKIIKPIIRRYGSNFIKIFSKLISHKMIKKYYARILNVDKNKIFLVNHHLCHAHSAVFNLDINKEWLIFTVDAEGDLESGTVYELKKNN